MFALAAIYDGATRAAVAEIGSVTRQIIRDWVLRFNASGPQELVDRPRHHPQAPSRRSSIPTLLASVAHQQGVDVAGIEVWFEDEARIGKAFRNPR